MATVLITGGTGLIGTALANELLIKNYDVIILTRAPGKYSNTSRLSYASWDIENQTIDSAAIMKADYIVHLAGANMGEKRWTSKRKKEIIESRTKSGALLKKALHEISNNVKAVISASAIGWYGSDTIRQKPRPFVETDPPSDNFPATTCKQWEESIDPIAALGKRLVKFRTGIVLSNDGGALKEFKKPLRFGLATVLGNGRQVMSWIHIDDLIRLYIYAIEKASLQGVYNAVTPSPVTNKKLILQLAKSMRGRFFVPIFVPSFVLEILLGELSIEVLKSTTVSCEKIKSTGFTFLYPSITSAIQKLAVS